jgi:hypothetical protein
MAIQPDVQITGKLANIAGFTSQPLASIPEEGSIDVALCGYGPQTPSVGGEALFARITNTTIPVGATGNFSVFLYSNAKVIPAGTYYTFTIRDANGDVVQTEAYYLEPGAWDLSNMQPYDPGQPPPPLPPLIIPQLLIIAPSAEPVFDGTNFTAFQITLPGNVTQAFIQNMVPGNLYTFVLLQDSTGGHTFVWPTDTYNAGPINPTINGYTVQTFVALDDGSLWAIGPGGWFNL